MSSVRKDNALYAKIKEYFINNLSPTGYTINDLLSVFHADRPYFVSVLNTLCRNNVLIKKATKKKGKNYQPIYLYYHFTQPEIHELISPKISPCIFTNNSQKNKYLSSVHPERIVNAKNWQKFIISKKTHFFMNDEYKKLK